MNFEKTQAPWSAKAAAFLAAVLLVVSPLAQACRDCPFPAKISDGRWMMPNGQLQLEIDAVNRPKNVDEVYVILRDTRTGEIVARGVSIQRRDRRTVTVALMDKEGRMIKGFVHYLDNAKAKIQAKFTCDECKIQPMLD